MFPDERKIPDVLLKYDYLLPDGLSPDVLRYPVGSDGWAENDYHPNVDGPNADDASVDVPSRDNVHTTVCTMDRTMDHTNFHTRVCTMDHTSRNSILNQYANLDRPNPHSDPN